MPAPLSLWVPWIYWIGFHVLLLCMLAAELFATPRTQPSMQRAVLWTGVWIAVALGFCGFVLHAFGRTAAVQFLTSYLVEQSLSADNLFLFLVLFRAFQVPRSRQRSVLTWGVFGAILMRGFFVLAGIQLLSHFGWVRYLFAAILLAAAVRLLMPHGESSDEVPRWLKWLNTLSPVSLDQTRFFTRENGRRMVTVLFLALLAIEITDVVFALDSVPAVLSITRNSFIAYTSNMLAVMGLRSLYFVLAGALSRLRLLHYGLAVVLVFVGVKMLLENIFAVSALASLAVILGILAITIAASLLSAKPAAQN